MAEKHANDRRNKSRCQVGNSVAAILKPNFPPIITPLLNISPEGLAFSYSGTENIPKDIIELDILVHEDHDDNDLFLGRLKGEVVSVSYLRKKQCGCNLKKNKRYCVKFTNLTNMQEKSIKRFINSQKKLIKSKR